MEGLGGSGAVVGVTAGEVLHDETRTARLEAGFAFLKLHSTWLTILEKGRQTTSQ